MSYRLVVSGAKFNFYGGGSLALPDIDISFDRLLVIKGQIGSGKTVLLKSLGGLFYPDDGEISLSDEGGKLEGYFVHSQAEFNFVTGTVKDELDFAGVPRDNFTKYLDKNVNTLSGGELKRISLMMALEATDGPILLDEPLDMMDDVQSPIMAEYILAQSKGRPIIITTHDSYFDSYADQIVNIASDDDITIAPVVNIAPLQLGDIVLEVSKLIVALPDGGKTLHPFNIHCSAGEVVALLGLNGSGKTVVIRTISGIGRHQYSGEYRYGVDRKRVGICLQFPEQMIYQETIAEEIADVAGAENIDLVLRTLSVMNINWLSRGESSPFSLSDGEKRSLYIISFLVGKEFCIFDEPFAGLDGRTIKFVLEQFDIAKRKGKGILFTANRAADAALADRVVTIVN